MMDLDPKRWPAWRYHKSEEGKLEKQIFTHPDDVPEGWVDSPAKVDLGAPKVVKPVLKVPAK